MDLNELLRERTRIIAAMRQLIDKASAEARDLTSEEEANYTRMDEDLNTVDKKIEREKRLRSIEADNPDAPIVPDGDEDRAASQRADSFRRFLIVGERGLRDSERRALQMDSNAAGGYLIAPQQFSNELLQAVDNQVFMRSLATIDRVPNAQSLGIPSLDADPADPAWTSEIATGTEDSTMSFGKRELHPHPLAKLIKVSNKLIRASAGRVDALVRERLAYKVGVTLENAYLNGSGANQPLGVFVAHASGISTARDVTTGNTKTTIGADGLIEAKYSLKGQYQNSPNLRWIFHRDAVKMIRKLKDGDGQYLWRPGLASDTGDTILGVQFVMSEYAPNTFTQGLYVGIIGDFKFYRIADALDLQLQVLDQLYAATNQTGYIVRVESDGMPVLEEAFARVTLAV